MLLVLYGPGQTLWVAGYWGSQIEDSRHMNVASSYVPAAFTPEKYSWYSTNKKPTWCHLLFYFTSYRLNLFRTLVCPSSGACDYAVELPHWSFHSSFAVCWRLGAVGLEYKLCFSLQPGYYSSPTVTNLQHTANQERNDQWGNSTA